MKKLTIPFTLAAGILMFVLLILIRTYLTHSYVWGPAPLEKVSYPAYVPGPDQANGPTFAHGTGGHGARNENGAADGHGAEPGTGQGVLPEGVSPGQPQQYIQATVAASSNPTVHPTSCPPATASLEKTYPYIPGCPDPTYAPPSVTSTDPEAQGVLHSFTPQPAEQEAVQSGVPK